MYQSELNSIMSRSNEDLLENSPILRVESSGFFLIDNRKIIIGSKSYNIVGHSMLSVIRIMEESSLVVTRLIQDSELFMKPATMISSYSNMFFKKIIGSPRDLSEEMFRFQDLSYDYVTSGDATIVSDKFLSSKQSSTNVIKFVKVFNLHSTLEQYRGI